MQRKKTKFLILLSTLLFIFASLSFVYEANADSGYDKALKGLNQSANKGYLNGDTDGDLKEGIISDIPASVGKILGAALQFLGVLFFGLVLYAGFLWMTARGNTTQVDKAKDLLVDAVIGLVIVMSAYAITAFIGGTLI